jgi:6-phosphogluconolactonase
MPYHVYVGTYTNTTSQGIHILRLDESGALSPIGAASGLAHPSFVALSADHSRLYAVNEISDYGQKRGGAVSAFSRDGKTGLLSLLNQQATQGPGACYISLDASGKWALVANYHGGSVTVLPILAGGTVGAPSAFVQHNGPSRVNPRRQEAAHAHSFITDPTNRFALCADLGMDKIVVYKLDTTKGTLTPHEPPYITARPGAGPRHQVFHPNGRTYYVVNELDSTVSVLEWDEANGTGREVQAIWTLPAGFTEENTTAEILMSPSGRFVYASNRGHHSLAIFAVDDKTGKLTACGHAATLGKTPRSFGFAPGGNLLVAANQDSDTLVSYRVDQATGQLAPTGHRASVPRPVCVRIIAASSP